MAVRAYWKGSLKLSLVSCPVLLYPASTSAEKTRFHMINKETGNRLKQQMVDAETGDVVESDQKGRGSAFPRTPGDAPPQQESASLGGASAQGELRALVSALARSEATKQSMHFRFNFQTAQTVIASEAKQSIVPRKERWIASSLRSSQ